MTLAIVTGELPPMPGGVADYSAALAHELRARGRDVLLVAPGEDRELGGTQVVGARSFAIDDLVSLGRQLDAQVTTWLVQWVPHAYGLRSMNAPFVAWWARRPARRWAMFHEVALPFGGSRGWKGLAWNGVAATHRALASTLALSAERRFVSTLAWRRVLGVWGLRDAEWLPVPSNFESGPTASDVREVLGLPAGPLVVHFGTYGAVAEPLRAVLEKLAHVLDDATTVVLAGRGSIEYRASVSAAPRSLVATGELEPALVRGLLREATLALQPYPDGVTTRRGTAMAALAAGCPLVTSSGTLSEPFWASTNGAVVFDSAPRIADAVVRLLSDGFERSRLAAAGRALYERSFAMARTVDRLLGPADPSWSVTP